MATLTLQNWHADDDGTPRANKTVVYKLASESEPNANPVLGTTTTNASGKWQFTGVADGNYDVYLTDGASVRFWKGLAALPLTFAKVPVGPVANALVNGDFTVAQRGASFVSPANLAYTLDRWQWNKAGTGDVTITQDTDVPTVGSNAINTTASLKIDVTTADAAIAAGDVYSVFQDIEGFDYRALTNGFALSFWVKAAKTGVHAVAFVNTGGNRSWVAEYTVTAANTWEYKTVVVTSPPTAGTWNYDTGKGLRVFFNLVAGTTFQTTAGAWQVGSFYATAASAANNEMDNTANNFWLALVNLIPGSTAAPFVPQPYQQQLARCQRYYEVFGGVGATMNFVVYQNATAAIQTPLYYGVPKGGTPTVTSVGAWGMINTVSTKPTVGAVGTKSCQLSVVATALGACGWANDSVDDVITVEWNP